MCKWVTGGRVRCWRVYGACGSSGVEIQLQLVQEVEDDCNTFIKRWRCSSFRNVPTIDCRFLTREASGSRVCHYMEVIKVHQWRWMSAE